MLYSKVYLEAFGYELPPNVVTSLDLEKRLEPVYEALHFQQGQLEAITGIRERRFWDEGFKMHVGAIKAGRKALDASGIASSDIGMLIYGGVCRGRSNPACEETSQSLKPQDNTTSRGGYAQDEIVSCGRPILENVL